MFTFLNSFILITLVAISIPVLIHLFNKQKTKKVKFSSLRFLKKIEKHRVRKIKIYQVILLIIRTLLITLLIFGFARPTISASMSLLPASSANTTAVVIIDDGLSMRTFTDSGSRFNRAINKAKQILKGFTIYDKVKVITSNGIEVGRADSTNLDILECTYKQGNLENCVKSAQKFIKENLNLNKEIHLISDMEIIDEYFKDFSEKNDEIRIYLHKINDSSVLNVSVDSIFVENKIIEINKPVTVKTYLSNHSKSEALNIDAHLFLNNKRMAQNSTVITANEKKMIELTFTPKQFGRNPGYIEINDDGLLADNQYYFSIQIPEKSKILFVDDNPTLYLKSALMAINQGASVDVVMEKYNVLARINFKDYDGLILGNFPELSPEIIDRLNQFIQNDGGIILIPGNQLNIRFFNKLLSLLGTDLKIINQKKVENKGNYFSLKKITKNNPVLSEIFRINNPEIAGPKVKKYFKFSNTDKFEELLSFENDDPFLLTSGSQKDNITIFSSYFDDSWSDLQYKGLYVPLILKMIKFTSHKSDLNRNRVLVGNTITINIPQGYNTNRFEVYSSKTDDEGVMLSPTIIGTRKILEIKDINRPGNYLLKHNSDIINIISANVKSRNIIADNGSLLTNITESENIYLINENVEASQLIKEARFGEELWKHIITLVVIFLLLETFIIKKIEGKF